MTLMSSDAGRSSDRTVYSPERGVAQPGSAPALGAGGPRFESGRPDGGRQQEVPANRNCWTRAARKLGDAGVDLGAMGIQWGKRPDELPTCSIQDRDLRLLRFLHDFGYTSTSTLAAMVWGRYGSAVRER